MRFTANELIRGIVAFTFLHFIYNIITVSVLFDKSNDTIGWCSGKYDNIRWGLTGLTGPVLFLSMIAALCTAISALNGINKSEVLLLRRSQYIAMATIVAAAWGLIGLYHDIGIARGRGEELLNKADGINYCYYSIPAVVYAVLFGWIMIIPVQYSLYVLSKTVAATLDPEAAEVTFLGIALKVGRRVSSAVQNGRRRLTSTIFLAKRYAKSSIRVKRQHDDIFREVDFSTLLLKTFTLQELREAIGARFDMPVNDIRALLKNGNVVIENDDDVARLTREDYIDVVFGNAMPFEAVPDLVPVYAPFNGSSSQIV